MSSAVLGLGHFLRRQRDKAVIDRYGLVRNFFIRQASASQHGSLSFSRFQQVTLSPISSRALYSKAVWSGRSTTLLLSAACSNTRTQTLPHLAVFRHLHTTRLVAQDRRLTEENRTPSDEKKSVEDSDNTRSSPVHPDHRTLENYSKFFRQLAMSLPHVHRPTRDDFLNAATGFWQRLRIRFKWATIRSFRKYNVDDISAFVTWFFMSQTLWLFVGT